MKKKSFPSAQPSKPIRVSAEPIWNKPLTERQKVLLDLIAARQQHEDVSRIDYCEIPAFTDKQLAQFRRAPKKLPR